MRYMHLRLLLNVILAIVWGARFMKSYVHKRAGMRLSFKNSPVLLMQSMRGDVVNGHQGNTPAGLPYTYLLSGMKLFSSSRMLGTYAVYLPFQTSAHLVGLPKGQNMIKIRPSHSGMEEIILEGDYPKYFQLFADRGQQTESRYVLDPKAMVFTIDFCAGTYWEIVDNTLFFTSERTLPSFTVVDRFVKEIRPALEVEAPKDHSRISYGHMNITDFHCPVCDALLVDGESWMECPNSHGFLITGHQMRSLRSKITYPTAGVAYDDKRTDTLKCPYCARPMISSRYQFTDITIDRCSRCIYRWIDKPEAAAVLGITGVTSQTND